MIRGKSGTVYFGLISDDEVEAVDSQARAMLFRSRARAKMLERAAWPPEWLKWPSEDAAKP